MKYMGGKSRSATKLILFFPKEIQTYVEPFVGSGAVLERVNARLRVGIDSNKYMIALLQKIQDGPITREMMEPYNKEIHKAIQKNPDAFPAWKVGAAMFPLAFGGKPFGGYTEPVFYDICSTHRREFAGDLAGKQAFCIENGCGVRKSHHDGFYNATEKMNLRLSRDYLQEFLNNTEKTHPRLQGGQGNVVAFTVGDYKLAAEFEDAVIYCDPPYKNTTNYGTPFDSEEFFDWAATVKAKQVFISEYIEEIPGFEQVFSFDRFSRWKDKTHAAKKVVERLFKRK